MKFVLVYIVLPLGTRGSFPEVKPAGGIKPITHLNVG